jgi:SAM-dependent methyltransferase
MDSHPTAQDTWLFQAHEISEDGERVSHLNKDHVFYGHLSIYSFAAQFCRGAFVLDAGSGAGYGAAYLADRGARHVLGIDVSAKAIAFSRHHFQRPNLDFKEMGLEHLSGLPPKHFDVIFTSNTLEHVPDARSFLESSWRILKPTGTVIVAVPPITDDRLLYLNLINPYHLNIWSPRQWSFVLDQFFEEVTPYLHGVEAIGADFRPEHTAANSTLTEESFIFEQGTVGDMYDKFTLTAIFVAERPQPETALPPKDAPLPFVDDSFTRPPGYIDPRLRRKLRRYFKPPSRSLRSLLENALQVLRGQGVRPLARETVAWIGKCVTARTSRATIPKNRDEPGKQSGQPR